MANGAVAVVGHGTHPSVGVCVKLTGAMQSIFGGQAHVEVSFIMPPLSQWSILPPREVVLSQVHDS
jgi:hypothetical protein